MARCAHCISPSTYDPRQEGAPMDAGQLLTLLLGGGGVAFVTAVFQGYRSLRAGARAHEKEAVKDIADARAAAEDSLEYSRLELSWWQRWAGMLEYALARNGIEQPPRPPYPDRRDK